MAVFSEAIKERIRAASDIVDVIGAYLPLKRAGANFTGLCPFHKEKTPSFNVNPHKQIFHCFGCHKGGDVFTFVKEYENIGFGDAVRRLADRAKIPIEQDANPGEQQARHLKDQLLEIHEKIAQRWQNCLQNEAAGQLARDYLKKRGVGEEAIKLFRIGAAPESWDDTVNWAKSKGYDLALVEKTGLVIRKEETGSHYDRFRGRLMFPICDEQGRVVAFSGRVLSGDEKTAKYVNSPETAIFTKSKIFYGLDKSKRAILDAGYAIICEGQLDLIACFMAGVQNIVAPQGTAFTDQHARILKRYVNEVVLCFDSDNAGQNAAVRSLDHLLASGMAVRVAVVPAPHDPDSFIKAFGGEKYRELVNNAKGFFDYYLERLSQQNEANTDKGRLAILSAMAEAVHKTGSAVLTDTYAQKTALRLGVSPEAVRAEFKKNSTLKPSINPDEEIPETEAVIEVLPPSLDELGVLQFLLKTDEFVEWISEYIDPAWVNNETVRKILEMRIQRYHEKSWNGFPQFLNTLGDESLKAIVTEAVSINYRKTTDVKRGRELPNPFEDLKGLATQMRKYHLQPELNHLESLNISSQMGDAERADILRKSLALKAIIKGPLKPISSS